MSTKSKSYLYGHDIRWSAEQAAHERKKAEQLACEAWSKRMLVSCASQRLIRYLVDLAKVPWPSAVTPIPTLERSMRCEGFSERTGMPYKRSHLVALRPNRMGNFVASTEMSKQTLIRGAAQPSLPRKL